MTNADVRKTIDRLFAPEQVVEVRAIKASTQSYTRPHTEAGYFDGEHRNELVDAVSELDGNAVGIYVTLNQLDDALLARAANRIKTDISTTADTNITRRRNMLIDIDAGNPADTSSTDKEHEAAIETARSVYKELRKRNWPDMAVADSGNGAHVYVPIDLPADDDGLVKQCLIALSLMFDNGDVKVDTSVFNPARITKLVGTLVMKGDSIPDRPHRRSKWLHTPDGITPVSIEMLKELAAYAPDLKAATPMRKGEFDLGNWINEQNVPIRRGPEPWNGGGNGAVRYQLESCPWNQHQDSAPYLIQFGNGAISAGCHHNSCQGYKWQDFRQHYEPDYDPNRVYDRRDAPHPANKESATDDTPRLTITNAAGVQPQRVEWLWDKRIPAGKFTILAGDPDLGKSTLLLDIAARVSRGGTWVDGGQVRQGNVLIVTGEDGIADTVVPRLMALGADLSRVDFIGISVREGERDVSLSLPDHMPMIEDAIIKYGATLLIIDPVLAFTGGKRVDANKTNEVRPILMQLAGIAERTGCAIVGLMHLNKNSTQGNSIYRISASLAFAAAARSVLGVAKHPDQPTRRVLVSIKHNLSPESATLSYHFDEDGKFTWDAGAVDIDAASVFATPAIETGSAIEEADDFIEQVMAAKGSVKYDELLAEAKTQDISAASLKRAKAKRVGTDREIKSERITMGNEGDGFWLWHYLSDEERALQDAYTHNTLNPLRNNGTDTTQEPHNSGAPVRGSSPSDKGVNKRPENTQEPHGEATPVRGSSGSRSIEPLTGTPVHSDAEGIVTPNEPLAEPPLEPLTGMAIHRDIEGSENPKIRKGFNETVIRAREDASDEDSDIGEV